MTANPDDIVSQITKMCQHLTRSVRKAKPGASVFEMESFVFEGLQSMGALLLEAFLQSQAPHFHHSSTQNTEGHTLRYRDERGALVYSIFGKIRFSRSYYCSDGHGYFPMDAALNLVPSGQSDFVRKMVEELSVNLSYEDAAGFLAKYFPVAASTRAVQEAIQTDSQDAQAYYEEAAVPPPCPSASIQVIQADGKGVPMVRPAAVACAPIPTPGQGKGEKRREGKTKEVTVVSVSTHAPFHRTPEQVRDNLFQEAKDTPCYDPRQKPAFKRVWATIKGKDKALAQAKVWAAQTYSEFIQDLVALTDGLEALQRRVDEYFPRHVRVLDLIHAVQYLWKAADARFGRGKSDGWKWVHGAVLVMLQGRTAAIIEELDAWADEATDQARLDVIECSATYFEKNLSAMKYDEYLARGWPIATGIIEGACRHVVKDRCERSGMRWTEQGVESFLHLRCIHQNGDWDAYHDFRTKRRHERVYKAYTNHRSTAAKGTGNDVNQAYIKLAA